MKKRVLSLLLALVMVISLLPAGALAAEENYELRVLTFEDEDYKGDTNFAGGNDWSSLIDDPQSGGSLLYGGATDEEYAYKWYDKNNTELKYVAPLNYGSYDYWGGGHAISHYNTADYETYCDYTTQLTVYNSAAGDEIKTAGGGYNGSDNFAVHYGYMDGSAYNFTEELPSLSFGDGKARVIDHMYVNNTCYQFYCYKGGNEFTNPVGEGDWVKLIATGYNGETSTGTAEMVFVDGPDGIITDWTKWDLSGLGAVTKVEFNVDCSSDNGFGNSQPSYFAYDNVAVRFEKETVEVTSVTLDQSELALEVGGSETLTATVKPDEATDKTVTWDSADEKIATVDENGKVTAVAAGETAITAKAGEITAECVVTVTAAQTGGEGITKEIAAPAPEDTSGMTMAWVDKITISGLDILEQSAWHGDGDETFEIDVVLVGATKADAVFDIVFGFTGNHAMVTPRTEVSYNGDIEKVDQDLTWQRSAQLSRGVLCFSITAKDQYGISRQYILNFSTADSNQVPILTGSDNASVDLKVGQTYTLDVTELFEDKDGDELTYTVDGEEIANPTNYTFTPDSAGTKTLTFKANDGKADSDPYTVILNVTANSIPSVSAESETVNLDQYKTKTIDLSKIFTDADKDELSYYVDTGDGEKQAIDGSIYTYDTSENGEFTLKFYAKDAMDFSAAYTVTLTVNPVDRYVIETGDAGGEFIKVGTVTEIYIDYQKVADSHYAKYEDGTRTIAVQLDEKVADDATLEINYLDNQSQPSLTPSNPIKLTGGEAVVELLTKGHSHWYNTPHTYTIYLFNKANIAPALKVDAAEVSVEKIAGETYELDLADIFTDANGDVLRYTLSINSETQVLESTEYSLTENALGNYKLVFTATDIWGEEVTYTVNLTVKNSGTKYNVTVKIPNDITPVFSTTGGFTGVGEDIPDAELEADKGGTSGGYTAYTVKVPENISRISVRGTDSSSLAWGGMSLPVEKDMAAVTMRQVRGVINTSVSGVNVTADQAVFRVMDKDGYYAVSGGTGTDDKGVLHYRYLLAAYGLEVFYTFTAEPLGDLTDDYGVTSGETKTVVEGSGIMDSPLPLSLKKTFTITAPSDATVQMFRQNKYYDVSEITAQKTEASTTKNGFEDHVFSVSSGAANLSYRVSMSGKITKAGYVNSSDGIVVEWTDSDPAPSCRTPYNTNTLYGSRGDDSVMVNINGQNQLVLNTDETFRLKAYRIWEIINSDTANKMIEPDFSYEIISGSDVIDAAYVTEICTGNAKNNWIDITAKAPGTAILEIRYDALDILSGNQSASGGSEVMDKFTFNACDSNRTALIVVQVGTDAADVNFGIASSSMYNGSSAAWDAEFDTVYFTGESGKISFKPVANGISEVAVSNDKGMSWTTLNAVEGVYTANIVPGNNILRVTASDGTAYQVVRGDKVTVAYTEKSGDGDAVIEAGETVRVSLNGLHNPIGKMSGVYNPGYQYGQHLSYVWNGGSRIKTAEIYQYNFVGNAHVDVTIPDNAAENDEFALSDGYIDFNYIGGPLGGHRTLPDEGISGPLGAGGNSNYRCILPTVSVTVGGEMSLPDSGDKEEDKEEEEEKPIVPPPVIEDEDLAFGLDEDEIVGYVTVSFEDYGGRLSEELSGIDSDYKYPLGVIIKPTKVPFKAYDTIAAVTLRLLDAKGIGYSCDGNAFSNFYLELIEGFTVDGETYGEFGEFDAGQGSGWMITWDEWFINKGASEFTVDDGDVVKWQYTCQLGADIGDNDWINNAGKPEEKEEESVTTTLTPEASVDSTGAAKAEVSAKDVADALKEAENEGAAALEIAPEIKGEANEVTVELPSAALDKVADSGLALKVTTPVANINLPKEAVSHLAKKSGKLSVTAAEDKNGKVTIDVSVGGNTAADIPGGIIVDIPAEKVSSTSVIVIVNADGSETIVKKSVSDADGVTALLSGSATVKLIDNKQSFTDTDAHWGRNHIEFATSRGLFNGVGEGRFDPDGTMTRAMLATTLFRLEDAAASGENKFADVPSDTWYTDAVTWANESKIVEGNGNGFDPNGNITREQMATMLYRYANMLGMNTKAKGDMSKYGDSDSISGWAKDAMEWAVGVGLINGKGEAGLDPQGNATRAEVATIYQRMIALIVK